MLEGDWSRGFESCWFGECIRFLYIPTPLFLYYLVLNTYTRTLLLICKGAGERESLDAPDTYAFAHPQRTRRCSIAFAIFSSIELTRQDTAQDLILVQSADTWNDVAGVGRWLGQGQIIPASPAPASSTQFYGLLANSKLSSQ
jgi:hypothetical protein